MPTTKDRIYAVLSRAQRPLSPQEIGEEIPDVAAGTVRGALRVMVAAGDAWQPLSQRYALAGRFEVEEHGNGSSHQKREPPARDLTLFELDDDDDVAEWQADERRNLHESVDRYEVVDEDGRSIAEITVRSRCRRVLTLRKKEEENAAT